MESMPPQKKSFTGRRKTSKYRNLLCRQPKHTISIALNEINRYICCSNRHKRPINVEERQSFTAACRMWMHLFLFTRSIAVPYSSGNQHLKHVVGFLHGNTLTHAEA